MPTGIGTRHRSRTRLLDSTTARSRSRSEASPPNRSLDAAQWRIVRRLFHRHRGAPTPPTLRVLLAEARGDAAVAAEAAALLAPSPEGTEFLRSPFEPRPRARAPFRRGDVLLGRYRLGARLGRGGSAEVFGATDCVSGAAVAVKVMAGRDRDAVRREAAALLWLSLPGVVRLLDDGFEKGTAFLVMERVRGRPFPGRATPLPWSDLEPIMLALLETVGRMHTHGLVHGDLKPGNVLVDGAGRLVVLDLGVTRDSADDGSERRLREGTPGFAAPERWRGAPPDVRSDLHSLGTMARRALGATGDGPPPASSAPAGMRAVLAAMVAVRPSRRPASVAEVLQRLRPSVEAPVEILGDARRASDLESLFDGPEPFLHLPSGAARELFRRTGGRRDEMRAETASWMRAGLAERTGKGRLVVGRAALERLEAGLPTRGKAGGAEGDALGAALLQGRDREALRSATRRARAALRRGRPEAALEAATAGLAAASLLGDKRAEGRLLVLALRCALRSGRLPAVERVRSLALRASPSSPGRDTVEMLARGALLCLTDRCDEAVRLLSSDAAIADADSNPSLDHARRAVLMRAARAVDPATEGALVAAAARWARRVGTPEVRGAVAEWRGWHRYRTLRFDAARRSHLEAADLAIDPASGISRTLNAAAAALDGFRLEEALRLATRAESGALRLRHPLHEARAACIRREALYRMGRAGEPRPDLVEAALATGIPHEACLLALNEAAVAWRTQQLPLARRLAGLVATKCTSPHQRWLRRLAEALAWRCGGPEPTESEATWREDIAPTATPAVARQAKAMRRGGALRVGSEMDPNVNRRGSSSFREVLSDDEIDAMDVMQASV